MAYKQFALDESISVTIYKRRRSRYLRLSVNPAGQVRVSIPLWTPYKAGLEFARARLPWIISQQKPAVVLADGQAIGKAHRLRLLVDDSRVKPVSRIKSGDVVISFPGSMDSEDTEVQRIARAASVRALRQQAEKLLPARLDQLAVKHGFQYHSVKIKHLKGRWGSCDHQQRIVLNLFLLQLPWELIDYVLLHELTHTRVFKHGPEFWQAMSELLHDTPSRRKQLRSFHPMLNGSLPDHVA